MSDHARKQRVGKAARGVGLPASVAVVEPIPPLHELEFQRLAASIAMQSGKDPDEDTYFSPRTSPKRNPLNVMGYGPKASSNGLGRQSDIQLRPNEGTATRFRMPLSVPVLSSRPVIPGPLKPLDLADYGSSIPFDPAFGRLPTFRSRIINQAPSLSLKAQSPKTVTVVPPLLPELPNAAAKCEDCEQTNATPHQTHVPSSTTRDPVTQRLGLAVKRPVPVVYAHPPPSVNGESTEIAKNQDPMDHAAALHVPEQLYHASPEMVVERSLFPRKSTRRSMFEVSEPVKKDDVIILPPRPIALEGPVDISDQSSAKDQASLPMPEDVLVRVFEKYLNSTRVPVHDPSRLPLQLAARLVQPDATGHTIPQANISSSYRVPTLQPRTMFYALSNVRSEPEAVSVKLPSKSMFQGSKQSNNGERGFEEAPLNSDQTLTAICLPITASSVNDVLKREQKDGQGAVSLEHVNPRLYEAPSPGRDTIEGSTKHCVTGDLVSKLRTDSEVKKLVGDVNYSTNTRVDAAIEQANNTKLWEWLSASSSLRTLVDAAHWERAPKSVKDSLLRLIGVNFARSQALDASVVADVTVDFGNPFWALSDSIKLLRAHKAAQVQALLQAEREEAARKERERLELERKRKEQDDALRAELAAEIRATTPNYILNSLAPAKFAAMVEAAFIRRKLEDARAEREPEVTGEAVVTKTNESTVTEVGSSATSTASTVASRSAPEGPEIKMEISSGSHDALQRSNGDDQSSAHSTVPDPSARDPASAATGQLSRDPSPQLPAIAPSLSSSMSSHQATLPSIHKSPDSPSNPTPAITDDWVKGNPPDIASILNSSRSRNHNALLLDGKILEDGAPRHYFMFQRAGARRKLAFPLTNTLLWDWLSIQSAQTTAFLQPFQSGEANSESLEPDSGNDDSSNQSSFKAASERLYHASLFLPAKRTAPVIDSTFNEASDISDEEDIIIRMAHKVPESIFTSLDVDTALGDCFSNGNIKVPSPAPSRKEFLHDPNEAEILEQARTINEVLTHRFARTLLPVLEYIVTTITSQHRGNNRASHTGGLGVAWSEVPKEQSGPGPRAQRTKKSRKTLETPRDHAIGNGNGVGISPRALEPSEWTGSSCKQAILEELDPEILEEYDESEILEALNDESWSTATVNQLNGNPDDDEDVELMNELADLGALDEEPAEGEDGSEGTQWCDDPFTHERVKHLLSTSVHQFLLSLGVLDEDIPVPALNAPSPPIFPIFSRHAVRRALVVRASLIAQLVLRRRQALFKYVMQCSFAAQLEIERRNLMRATMLAQMCERHIQASKARSNHSGPSKEAQCPTEEEFVDKSEVSTSEAFVTLTDVLSANRDELIQLHISPECKELLSSADNVANQDRLSVAQRLVDARVKLAANIPSGKTAREILQSLAFDSDVPREALTPTDDPRAAQDGAVGHVNTTQISKEMDDTTLQALLWISPTQFLAAMRPVFPRSTIPRSALSLTTRELLEFQDQLETQGPATSKQQTHSDIPQPVFNFTEGQFEQLLFTTELWAACATLRDIGMAGLLKLDFDHDTRKLEHYEGAISDKLVALIEERKRKDAAIAEARRAAAATKANASSNLSEVPSSLRSSSSGVTCPRKSVTIPPIRPGSQVDGPFSPKHSTAKPSASPALSTTPSPAAPISHDPLAVSTMAFEARQARIKKLRKKLLLTKMLRMVIRKLPPFPKAIRQNELSNPHLLLARGVRHALSHLAALLPPPTSDSLFLRAAKGRLASLSRFARQLSSTQPKVDQPSAASSPFGETVSTSFGFPPASRASDQTPVSPNLEHRTSPEYVDQPKEPECLTNPDRQDMVGVEAATPQGVEETRAGLTTSISVPHLLPTQVRKTLPTSLSTSALQTAIEPLPTDNALPPAVIPEPPSIGYGPPLDTIVEGSSQQIPSFAPLPPKRHSTKLTTTKVVLESAGGSVATVDPRQYAKLHQSLCSLHLSHLASDPDAIRSLLGVVPVITTGRNNAEANLPVAALTLITESGGNMTQGTPSRSSALTPPAPSKGGRTPNQAKRTIPPLLVVHKTGLLSKAEATVEVEARIEREEAARRARRAALQAQSRRTEEKQKPPEEQLAPPQPARRRDSYVAPASLAFLWAGTEADEDEMVEYSWLAWPHIQRGLEFDGEETLGVALSEVTAVGYWSPKPPYYTPPKGHRFFDVVGTGSTEPLSSISSIKRQSIGSIIAEATSDTPRKSSGTTALQTVQAHGLPRHSFGSPKQSLSGGSVSLEVPPSFAVPLSSALWAPCIWPIRLMPSPAQFAKSSSQITMMPWTFRPVPPWSGFLRDRQFEADWRSLRIFDDESLAPYLPPSNTTPADPLAPNCIVRGSRMERALRDALRAKYSRLRHLFLLLCAMKGSGPANLDFRFCDVSKVMDLMRLCGVVDERNLQIQTIERIISEVVRLGMQSQAEMERREAMRKELRERQLRRLAAQDKKGFGRKGKRAKHRSKSRSDKAKADQQVAQIGGGDTPHARDGESGDEDEEEEVNVEESTETVEEPDLLSDYIFQRPYPLPSTHATFTGNRTYNGTSIVGVENIKLDREAKLDQSTPEKLITRDEFFEILIRCALVKFEASDPADVNQLEHRLMKRRPPGSSPSPGDSNSLVLGSRRNGDVSEASSETKPRTLADPSHRLILLLEHYIIPKAVRDLRLVQLDFRAFLATDPTMHGIIARHAQGLYSLFKKLVALSEQLRQQRNPFVPSRLLKPHVAFGPLFPNESAPIPHSPNTSTAMSVARSGNSPGLQRRSIRMSQPKYQEHPLHEIYHQENTTYLRQQLTNCTPEQLEQAREILYQNMVLDPPTTCVSIPALEQHAINCRLIGPRLSHRNLHIACLLSRDENADTPLLSFACFIEAMARIACAVAVTTAQYHSSASTSPSVVQATSSVSGSSATTSASPTVPMPQPPEGSGASVSGGNESQVESSFNPALAAAAAELQSGLSLPLAISTPSTALAGLAGGSSSASGPASSTSSTSMDLDSVPSHKYENLVWRSRLFRPKLYADFKQVLTILGAAESPQETE